MDQDCGDGTAEDGAAINGAENDQTGFRFHRKGHREHQGNAHGSGKARHTTDDDTHGDTGRHHQEIDRGQGIEKARAHQR